MLVQGQRLEVLPIVLRAMNYDEFMHNMHVPLSMMAFLSPM